MCGVCGLVSTGIADDEGLARLREAGLGQRHRGPDDSDEKLLRIGDRLVGLGFVRLSILDLETGMQPVTCHADGSVIACNGQVYNYLELKSEVSGEHFTTRGDMEVVLHLYRKLGTGFLDRLNGMYAGAIFDPAQHRLLLFRDRFGIKPLYYIDTDNGFFFASEIKSLLRLSGTRSEMDGHVLPTYLSYRYVPGERTMFRGVRRLPPGSILDMDLSTGKWEVKKYWEYLPGRELSITDPDEAMRRFSELLEDAVRIRMRSDVEVASLLSGGVDSSSVASLAAARQPDIKLFTVSFDDPVYDELGDVKNFLSSKADRFTNVQPYHRVCHPESLSILPDLLRSVEDCISLGTILPTDQVCALAAEHVKVVLTGEGADEVFGGYRKFLLEMAAEEYRSLSGSDRSSIDREFPELNGYMKVRAENPRKRFIQSELLFQPDELSRLLGREITDVPFPEDALPSLSPGMHPVEQLLAMECRSRLPDYVVLRLDKLSMRHSLETRTPYLDYRLAEFAAGLPVHLKVSLAERMGKLICRRSLERSGVVDPVTAYRSKKPFTIPMAAWLLMGDRLPDFVLDIFEGSETSRQGILDPGVVRDIWRRITSAGIGPETLVSDADRAFAVMTLSLWMREFL